MQLIDFADLRTSDAKIRIEWNAATASIERAHD
jgi:hypothetical protein